MKPHKHAELIKAWANGAEIEYKRKFFDGWFLFNGEKDGWAEDYEFRIKPEPKPDIERFYWITNCSIKHSEKHDNANLKLTFDGETGELKLAKVLK